MSATKLEIVWVSTDRRVAFRAELRMAETLGQEATQRSHIRELSSSRTALRCPNCASIVYSRRNKACGVCSETLPAHFLFTPIEAERIENLLAEERERHRIWMRRSSGGR